MRRFAVPLAVWLCLVTSIGYASAAPPVKPTPGAAGIGDPYFPDDGNGGYDVQHYDLDLSYEPSTDVLAGTATISATATQFLSRFNLDLDGLKVRAITVNGTAAKWHR
jgi:aminopeptidase N